MITKQFILKKGAQPGSAFEEVVAMNPEFVLMFGPAGDFEANGRVRTIAQKFKPSTQMIGCSTAGEITNDGVEDGTLVITACKMENKTHLKPASAPLKGMDDSHNAGKQLAQGLDKAGLKAVFILGPGLDINGSGVINGMKEVLGHDVPITGGLAGDGGAFKQTFTLLNGEIAPNRVVAMGVYGDTVKVSYGSMGGWEPFGPVRKVSKAHQNVLFELDGEPALALYKKYLGAAAKDLPASGLMYPFALLGDNSDDTTGIIRTILGIDEKAQSLTLAGDIPVNGRVRLMHSTKKGLTLGAQQAAELTSKHTGGKTDRGLAVLISCVGRKIVMGSDIEDELDAVRDVLGKVNVTGFYSYGEICPQAGFSECKLHNQTMTITWLTE